VLVLEEDDEGDENQGEEKEREGWICVLVDKCVDEKRDVG